MLARQPGQHTLDLARLVGPHGRVIAIDVQPKMLRTLAKRARRAGVAERIELREPKGESMAVSDLAAQADFVLAVAVVHELTNPALFFEEMFHSLKSGGKMLLVEPSGHVNPAAWQETLDNAKRAGFQPGSITKVRPIRTALLFKP